MLKENSGKKNCKNATLVNKAVSNTTGNIRLYLSSIHRGDHTIFDTGEQRYYEDIEAIRLDDYLKDYNGKIEFIKVDVEGAEVEVIQGMTNILRENSKVRVLSELWPSQIRQCGSDPGRISIFHQDLDTYSEAFLTQ